MHQYSPKLGEIVKTGPIAKAKRSLSSSPSKDGTLKGIALEYIVNGDRAHNSTLIGT